MTKSGDWSPGFTVGSSSVLVTVVTLKLGDGSTASVAAGLSVMGTRLLLTERRSDGEAVSDWKTGGVVSETVTVIVVEAVSPPPSVTCRVIMWVPIERGTEGFTPVPS